jgi:hypothetical protein
MIKRRKWILVALVCIFSLLFAAIFGISILKFNQYRTSVVSIYPAPGHPQVSITGPAHNSQFSLGAPIIVEATAFNSQGILSIELYIDGELTGVESAPAGGSDFFPADFIWSPPAPGVYALIARANGVDQLTTYSSPIKIKVTPPDFDPDAPDTTDYASPAPPSSYSPPVPESDANPAEGWNGTPGNWINSLVADGPPNPPELAVSLDGCSVLLSIHDLSDNEEGFEVWRLLPNSPSWSSIDVLASQSQYEWITYTDSGAHGGTAYYVSSFNSKGVHDSNLVHVNLDPINCPPPANEQSVLTLELKSLETLIPVDKLYCYFSLDGVSWMRRPEFGFWPGGDALQEQESYNSEIISLNLTGDDGSHEPEIKPLSFYLDCWGWQAGSLYYLGAISPSLDPNQPGSKQFGSDGFLAEVSLLVKELPDQLEFYPMGGAGEDDYEFGVSEDEIQVLPSWLESTIDPTMPKLYPLVTHNPEVCKSHLPPPFQNLLGQGMFCWPYPGFDIGNQGANPQPYFVWNPTKHCLKGFGEPPCKHYPYWISFAADLGHEVGFNIYDQNNKGFYIHQVTAPELFSFVIPPVPCSGMRDFWVQMWYYDGTSLLPTYGPPSPKFSIACPYKLGPSMALDIRFDMLRLYNVDDGEGGLQDVEVYGYLRASSGTMTRYLNLATWNQQASSCPDDTISLSLGTGGALGCPKTFTSGHYNLDDTTLCESKSYNNCSQSGWETNNNTIRLIIEESDSLTLKVKIVDWDDNSDNDLVCQGTFQIPSQSIFEWHKVIKQPFTIIGSLTDSGECRIEGVMNAVSP